MKHTILIFSQAMELGGVERSLLGLLDSIDYDRYDVDLFLMRHSGELMPYLNPRANLLPEISQYASLAVPMVSLLKNGQLRVLCGRLRGKLAAKCFDGRHPSSKPSVTALTYSHKYTEIQLQSGNVANQPQFSKSYCTQPMPILSAI